jgi:hypothetical protein
MGFESGLKVSRVMILTEKKEEQRKIPSYSFQKISTHSPFGVILKVDPQPPRCSWQE